MKFFELFVQHKVKAEDIQNYIVKWHKANTTENVFDYLGVTKEQYEIFIRHPEKAEQLRTKKEKTVSFCERIEKHY